MLMWIKIFASKIKSSINLAIYGWNDRDDDYYHVLKLLIYKLKKLHKCMKESEKLSSKDPSSKLLESINLLENGLNEKNSLEAIDYINQKYGKLEIVNENMSPNFLNRFILKREKVNNEEENQKYKEEMWELYAKAEIEDQQSIKKGFDIFAQEYLSWWV